MRSSKLFVILSVVAFATPALAQDAPPPPAGGPPPPGAAAPGIAGWPAAISDRPYTLNAGMLELHGALPIYGAGGDTSALLGVGAAYGVSDQIQVGGDYAFQLAPNTDAAGIFAAHVKLRLTHNQQMSAALGASIFYSDSLSSSGVTLLSGGISFRYRLNPQLSIYTDTNAAAGAVNIAGPVMGQGVVAIVSGSNGASGETLAGFTIPAGIAYQASPQLYLYGATVFGAIILSPQTDSFFLFRDVIPIVAGGWYSVSPKLEIGASITDDLKDAGNNYFFEFGGRIFM